MILICWQTEKQCHFCDLSKIGKITTFGLNMGQNQAEPVQWGCPSTIILKFRPYFNLIILYSTTVPKYCNCIVTIFISYHIKYVHLQDCEHCDKGSPQ